MEQRAGAAAALVALGQQAEPEFAVPIVAPKLVGVLGERVARARIEAAAVDRAVVMELHLEERVGPA